MPTNRRTKMSNCPHVKHTSPYLSWTIIEAKKMCDCESCNALPDSCRELWLCLQCLHCYCCSNDDSEDDHSLEHAQSSGHNLAMNLQNSRIWCYFCADEVFTQERNTPKFNIPDDVAHLPFDCNLWLHVTGDSICHMDPSQPKGLVGLRNLGNTCYMNSALQCLSNCLPLTTYFLSAAAPDIKSTRSSRVSHGYAGLIKEMWSDERPHVAIPTDLLRAIQSVNPSFRGFMQQDAQEFLRCLIDQLQEEMKSHVTFDPPNHKSKDKPKDSEIDFKSFVGDLFNGYLRSSVQCRTCKEISVTREAFQDLSLPIPSGDRLKQLHQRRSSSPTDNSAPASHMTSQVSADASQSYWSWIWSGFGYVWSYFKSFRYDMISLDDCLSTFFSTDELIGDNMYRCDKCKKLRDGIRDISIVAPPDILCIHLKRFRHEFMHSSKLSSVVEFPLTGLDLSKYVKSQQQPGGSLSDLTSRSIYNLSGVICHHGSVAGGHYTAFCKHPANSRWYEYDDSYVTEVTDDTVSQCQAYVLFYKRDDTHLEHFRQKFSHSIVRCVREPSMLQFYVSRNWMVKLFTSGNPGPISNSSDFLCSHGLVRPNFFPSVHERVIPVSTDCWQLIVNGFGGGPAVNTLVPCHTCQSIMSDLQKRRDTEKNEFHQRNVSGSGSGTHYAISTAWYRKWERFVDGRLECPPPPIDNQSIIDNSRWSGSQSDGKNTCGPAPLRRKSDFVTVNGRIWRYFVRTYSGGPTVILSRGRNAVESDDTEEEQEQVMIKQPTTPTSQTDQSDQSHESPDQSVISHSQSDPQLLIDKSAHQTTGVLTRQQKSQSCDNVSGSHVDSDDTSGVFSMEQEEDGGSNTNFC